MLQWSVMEINRFQRVLYGAAMALAGLPSIVMAQGQNQGGIVLLEPIGSEDQIDAIPGLGALGHYLSLLYPWMVGMGAGVTVLMAVIGGIQIIQSGGDQGKRDAGQQRLLMSLGGLLLILLSATILNALNPSFFK